MQLKLEEKIELFQKINLEIEIKESEAINAMLWLCGEYGENIEHAPYIFEQYHDDFSNLSKANKL